MSDETELVYRTSISQREWIDFIFSPAQRMVKNITSSYIMDRRKVYIWMFYLNDVQRRLESYSLRWVRRIQVLQGFIRHIKMRKAYSNICDTCINDTDLLGDSIEDSPHISVYLNSQKIRYTVHDIISLIEMHLEQREQFSSKPRLPIDPYTNKQWTIPIIYKIVGWLRNQNIKYKSIPYSVFAWIHSGYISFFRRPNTMPYNVSYHLEGKAKYNYCKTLRYAPSIINAIEHLCDVFETAEYHSRIDWDKMSRLPQQYVLNKIKPILLYWVQPNNEWIVEDANKPDYVLQRFKHDIYMMAEAVKCILKEDNINGAPRRMYRRRIQNYILV